MLFRANQMVSCCIYSAGGFVHFFLACFFFSSSLYFCSQITGSLVPRGRLVPPCATKLTVSLRPQCKFARKRRVLVAFLRGSSCAVRLTLGVYSTPVKTQTYELSLLWGTILPFTDLLWVFQDGCKNRCSVGVFAWIRSIKANREANANKASERVYKF